MTAAGATRHRHLPNGGIQWLRVKPWMCSIERCAPRRTAAWPWPSKILGEDLMLDAPLIFALGGI